MSWSDGMHGKAPKSVLGQRINNFSIVRVLGEGGMGTVYEAEHAIIRRKVAVKILRPELALDSVLVQRFFNEARATSAIRHPNIVEVIDLGLLPDGIPYLVMELLEGQSLAQRIARGALPVSLAVDFALQTASALQAAHDKHIVHRDLKPDNVFLVHDQRVPNRELVKVLDFGVAKLQRDPKAPVVNTLAGMIIGTPPYMSPEQCRGMPSEIDERTDVYALGVILYEMLCGEPPFVADNLSELITSHLTADPRPPSEHRSDLPRELEALIMHALTRERALRLPSMRDFAAALEVLQAQLPPPELEAPAPLLTPAHAEAPTVPQGRARASARRHTPSTELELHELELLQDADTTLPPTLPTPVTLTTRKRSLPRAALGVLLGLAASVLLGLLLRTPHTRLARRTVQQAERAQTQTHSALSTPEPQPLSAAAPSEAATAPPRDPEPPPMAAAASGPATSTALEPLQPTAAQPVSPAPLGNRPRPRPTPARSKPQSAALTQASGVPAVSTSRSPAPAPSATPLDAPALPGHLNLDSEPWAEVFLGSERLGTTPLMRVELPPGRHLLTLSNPELGVSISYAVEIEPGKTLSRLVGWAQR